MLMTTDRALISSYWKQLHACKDLKETMNTIKEFSGTTGKWELLLEKDESGKPDLMVYHEYYDDSFESFDYEMEPLNFDREDNYND